MDIRFCYYMDMIAREQNLSRAAQKLYITQSALSQQLDRMERELGTKLFLYRQNKMLMTETGQVFLACAREMIRVKEDAYAQIASLSRRYTEHISLAVSRQTGSLLISQILPRFKQVCPDVKVDILEYDTLQAKKLLMEGGADLALIAEGGEAPTLLRETLLYYEEIVLVIPRNHRLAARFLPPDGTSPAVPLSDLRLFQDDDFILSKPGTHFRMMEDRVLKQHAVTPHIFCEINNFYAVRNMVENGFGIALLHRSFVRGCENLLVVPFAPPFRYPFVAAHHRALALSQPMRELMRAMVDYCAEL